MLPSAALSQTDTVADYEVADGVSIEKSLTGSAGDAAKGRAAMINRKQGNCLACHAISALSDQPYHGETGPSLDGVADRYTAGELRLRIVDAEQVIPGTMMPSFYRNTGFTRVRKGFEGKSILNAEQVEDILAFLLTLK
jgi:sulfur-oxidizing protein SoxX